MVKFNNGRIKIGRSPNKSQNGPRVFSFLDDRMYNPSLRVPHSVASLRYANSGLYMLDSLSFAHDRFRVIHPQRPRGPLAKC